MSGSGIKKEKKSGGASLFQDFDEASSVDLAVPLQLAQRAPQLQQGTQDFLHLVSVQAVAVGGLRRGIVAVKVLAADTAGGAGILGRGREVKVVFVAAMQRLEPALGIDKTLVEKGIDRLDVAVEGKEKG